jgi:hypothetical protein
VSLCRSALLSVLFASPRSGVVEYEFGTTADFTGVIPIVPLLEGKESLLGDLGP